MKLVNTALLTEMLEAAARSPRRRSHHNFHAALDEPIHRLLIGALPDTEFPIHRHRDKWELFVPLAGRAEAVFYDSDGRESARHLLVPGGENRAVEVPAGVWHTYRILEPAVILEVKPGPYAPIGPEDILAPPEA